MSELENTEQLETLEGEHQVPQQTTKLFPSVEKLAQWLLFAKPQTFVVQTGHRQDNGQKVYQIQYEKLQ